MLPRPVVSVTLAAAVGCSAGQPLFQGVETNRWLAIDVPTERADEVVDTFRVRARSNGCSVDPIRTHSKSGNRGYTAYCFAGVVALHRWYWGVTLGCAKPITRAECVALFSKITAEP